MKFLNCTPHAIILNNGESFAPSGILPRVSASFTAFNESSICKQIFGDVENLPDEGECTLLIVSAMVLNATKAAGRRDCVAPATGHPDTIRNEKGHIVSVPGFVS